jgi:hypothetical protein
MAAADVGPRQFQDPAVRMVWLAHQASMQRAEAIEQQVLTPKENITMSAPQLANYQRFEAEHLEHGFKHFGATHPGQALPAAAKFHMHCVAAFEYALQCWLEEEGQFSSADLCNSAKQVAAGALVYGFEQINSLSEDDKKRALALMLDYVNRVAINILQTGKTSAIKSGETI